jgi:hypothetical protein
LNAPAAERIYGVRMILDVESLRLATSRGERFRYRFFWGHRPRKDGKVSDSCFSQWWRCSFTVDGQRYASAEQFMMAEKARLFGDEASRAHPWDRRPGQRQEARARRHGVRRGALDERTLRAGDARK